MVPVPGLVGEACLLQLPDAGRDEPEAVLPGGFVVEAVWQIGRGSGPQPLSGFKNFTGPCAMTAGSRVSGAAANGFRTR
jgi:hypothetical protein